MLNSSNVRELAYLVEINEVIAHPNADRLDIVKVGGWNCVCGKGEFKKGDYGIYFEIDSKLPEAKPFSDMEFLVSKHYKIKTQKIRGEYSQGLLIPISAFGGTEFEEAVLKATPDGEGKFVTNALKVIYAVVEDNKRKASSADKYKKMAQRHPKLFAKPFFRWMMKYNWGKKLLFLFFGKKKDKKSAWPTWVVKTDEERVQCMPWILQDKTPWFATEKIDGTSTTFTMKGFGRKREFYVCSRNVVFDKPDKQCYYDTNVYTEMAEKYDVERVLTEILDANKGVLEFITLQGETYGEGVQKRDYSLKGHDFMAFNLIFGAVDGTVKRLNPEEMTAWLGAYDIPCVPIVDREFIMPDTVEKLLEIATDKSAVDGGMREGLVFRSVDGVRSFKAVSNEFLMKYHQ